MGAAEWREADDLCSRLLPPTALDSLNVAPTPSLVACSPAITIQGLSADVRLSCLPPLDDLC